MKISGPNLFSTAGQVQLDELNLKSGQKVVGKILSIDQDEALLELAGHTIQAKIEGAPPGIGTNQTFLVSFDAEGRTILKMIKNFPGNADDTLVDSSSVGLLKTIGSAGNISFQKAITSALMKDNLPVSPENVTKIARYMQEFQSRYQQPIDPKVFSFMIAQKWPMTPGAILAAWINQEPEIRDFLRKKLQETMTQKEDNPLLLSPLIKLPGDASEITKKLKLAPGLQSSGTKSDDTLEPALSTSGSGTEISKKYHWLLEQNIDIHKALLKDATISSSANLIPLLVSDSESNIHECFIEWKKEKGNHSQNNTNNDQFIHVAIPTENLGIINLGLKIGPNGIQINIGVASEEVRQYLRTHTPEMKSAIAKENMMISVSVTDEEKPYSKAHGVDLWM